MGESYVDIFRELIREKLLERESWKTNEIIMLIEDMLFEAYKRQRNKRR